MSRPQAVPTVQIDNEYTRVTEWRFPPGSETGWHAHDLNYVVVPMTTGELIVEKPDGSASSSLVIGASYTRPVPSEHNVVNPGEEDFVFVEIEMKDSPA
ncbi:cupin domain-containing protein [Saxibacter everestensis]|uniref:Cupin domain-containing protein n=1 Tax=Saxibacter everestensis TaxID=2909229 RepID=A0ABY8QQP5_9MICO|nr:cupin domain-containing protein [Brevibacteriaceae bacterium ZFBP1038]